METLNYAAYYENTLIAEITIRGTQDETKEELIADKTAVDFLNRYEKFANVDKDMHYEA